MRGPDLELFDRSLRHATATHTGLELDAALDDLGWADALAEDASTAVSLLFEQQGSANATSSALDQLLVHTMELGSSMATAAVVLPALRQTSAPGRRDATGYTVLGLGLGTMARRAHAIVVVEEEEDTIAVAVPANALAIRPISGIDPALQLVAVSGTITLGDAEHLGPVPWNSAIALGQLALGHELVGAGRSMLELARQHALERVQFGRPIGSFQAVRHRLADTLIALEAADGLLTASWSQPTDSAAGMAKGLAGRQSRLAARHSQQVLAGIGFTAEHPLHRFIRRAMVLDQLLGAGNDLTRRTGAALLASRSLPPPLPL